jgi:GxxExxY protein
VKVNEITEAVIGAAIEVHRALGPGLLESAYIQCLCYELTLRKIPFELELPLPVVYKGFKRVWLSFWTFSDGCAQIVCQILT